MIWAIVAAQNLKNEVQVQEKRARSLGHAFLKKKTFNKKLAKCAQEVLDLYIDQGDRK